MKSTFWMTAQETEDELKSRAIANDPDCSIKPEMNPTICKKCGANFWSWKQELCPTCFEAHIEANVKFRRMSPNEEI